MRPGLYACVFRRVGLQPAPLNSFIAAFLHFCLPRQVLTMALRRLASSLVSVARPTGLQLVRNYRAAVLTEFGKPLQVQDLEPKPLGPNEVSLIFCSDIDIA